MILVLNKLSKKRKQDIEHLVDSCIQMEGLEKRLYLENDFNLYENLPCFFMYYKNDTLVSVLTIQQEKEDEVEIFGYTLPTERNKGYFKELLERAEDELIQFDLFRIVFVVEPASLSSKYLIDYCSATYDKSEYLLALDVNNMDLIESKLDEGLGLTLKELDSELLDEAITLSSSIFHSDYTISRQLLEDALVNNNSNSFLGVYEDRLIGICNFYCNETFASIYGIGIAKKEQGKGYGKALLARIIKYLRGKGVTYIMLQVSSENKRAIQLYNRFGFYVKSQYDYYSYELEVDE